MGCMILEAPNAVDRRPLRWMEQARPQPGPGELLVEVSACGVCRTDLQLVEGDLPLRVSPLVPGHQVVGRVSAVGKGVRPERVGERVGVAWLASTCGSCRFCKAGKENLCKAAQFTGWDRMGGYSQWLVAREDFAFRLPEGFSDRDGAPLLCGGVIGYRALRVSGVQPGERLGLYGFGASALLSLQVAKHWGCEVVVATRSKEEQERARTLGADEVYGIEEVPRESLDAAVTFAPAGRVVLEALKAVERGGAVAINAIHLDEIPSFSYDDLWWERSLRSVSNFTRADVADFLALAHQIPIQTTVEEFPMAQANEALLRLARGQIRGAAVLTWGA